ncbi:MAG: biotin/lipoate A/B protein ligase family protein [TACK group archaeon]|nr:biotin/lipoate A/B protein ligase family protein [TACK group archaeon]
MKVRVLEAEYEDPYYNLAVEEAIPIAVGRGLVDPTLRFWRNRNAVVIGRFQCPELEVNLKLAAEKGVRVVRRFTGGGAVYHDMGNVNYALSLRSEQNPDMRAYFEKVGNSVAAGLNRLAGPGFSYVPLNDIAYKESKVSGLAASIGEGYIFVHGALLANVDLNLLSSVLRPPPEKFEGKAVRSVAKRVANLSEIANRILSFEEIADAIIEGFKEVMGFEPYRAELSEEEKKIADQLYKEKYSTLDWSLGSLTLCPTTPEERELIRKVSLGKRGDERGAHQSNWVAKVKGGKIGKGIRILCPTGCGLGHDNGRLLHGTARGTR